MIRFGWFALLLGGVGCASAAEIAVTENSGLPVIVISGEVITGDAAHFEQLTAPLPRGAVILSSPGGNLVDGLAIGRTIAAHGFATGVPPDFVCASVCALMWSAGRERYMAASSLIGFHAAYLLTAQGPKESGVGNALVGAYLAELGLPTEAIVFATQSGPDDLNLLTFEAARRIGLDVKLLDERGSAAPSPAPLPAEVPLQLPKGYRWIVLAS